MANYHLSNKAVEDLSEIWNYTCDTWSEQQADTYYTTLLNYCKALADHVSFGKKYPEIMSNLLGYKVDQHIIFYREIAEKEIEVIRILHNRMDLKRRLLD